MSRRRSSGNPVNLFPFLDVLMSTLGALILLLGAVTRQAQLSREAEHAAIIAKQDLPELPPLPQKKQFPVLEPLPPFTDEPLPQLALPDLPPLPQKPLDLVAKRDALRAELAAIPPIADALSSDRRHRLSELAGYLKQLQRQLDEMVLQGKSQQDANEGLRIELAKLREMQRKLGLGSDHVENRYAIVPYTGPNGTERRPIYLECRRDSITLMPEGIVFGPELLVQPDDPDNPLAATVRAIVSEMNKLEAGSDPYPLLIVRPDGIAAYYLAQRALADVNVPTGYELVADNVALDFPKSDPRIESVARVVLSAFQRSSMGFAGGSLDGPISGSRPGLGRPMGGTGRGGRGSPWDPPSPTPLGASRGGMGGDPSQTAGGDGGGLPLPSPANPQSAGGLRGNENGHGPGDAGQDGTGTDLASVMDEYRSGPAGRARNAGRAGAGSPAFDGTQRAGRGTGAGQANSIDGKSVGNALGDGSGVVDPSLAGSGGSGNVGSKDLFPSTGGATGSNQPGGDENGTGNSSSADSDASAAGIADVRGMRPGVPHTDSSSGSGTSGPHLGQPNGGAAEGKGGAKSNPSGNGGGSNAAGAASAGSLAGNQATGMAGAGNATANGSGMPNAAGAASMGGMPSPGNQTIAFSSGGGEERSQEQEGRPKFDDLLFPQPSERPKPGEPAVEVDTFSLEGNPGEGTMRGVSGLKVDRRQIRRQVMIECREDGLILYPGQTYIPIDSSTSLDQVAADVTRHVVEQVQAWRRTGGMHYWQPVVTFYVRPDGLANYYGMRFSLLRTKLELDHRVIDWNMILEVPKLLRDKQTSVVLPSVIRL